jgi:hypothetical protein
MQVKVLGTGVHETTFPEPAAVLGRGRAGTYVEREHRLMFHRAYYVMA